MIENLICFTGRKRSGKDFLLKSLQQISGKPVVRLSFSDEMRLLANKVYPWLPKEIDDSIKDIPFVHPSNPKGYTPREIWIVVNGLREVEDDILVKNFIRDQYPLVGQNPDKLFVISDLRMPPEHAFINSIGCPIVKITRPDRSGIKEDDVESYIDQIVPDYEFFNKFDGIEEFHQFIQHTGLLK